MPLSTRTERRQKSKATSDDRKQPRCESQWNFYPQPPCLTVGCQHFDFFESIKVLLEVGLKLLNAFPQPPSLIKRRGRFCATFVFHFCCSPLVGFTKQGPLSRSWKHLSNVDSSSSFSPLSVFTICIFLSHRLAPCACRMTYAPLPPGSTPSAVVPRDSGPVVALWRGWERSLEPLGRRGSTWPERGSVILRWDGSHGMKSVEPWDWEVRGHAGGFNVTPGIKCHADY